MREKLRKISTEMSSNIAAKDRLTSARPTLAVPTAIYTVNATSLPPEHIIY